MVVRANSTGGVQLRLDAIEALEMHYTPPHGLPSREQPDEFAVGAAEALLDMIGFRDVIRDYRKYVTSATPDQTAGYILTQFALGPVDRRLAALIIIDELGFAPLDNTGAQLLFRFVAAAYERRSIGIGSHWPFGNRDGTAGPTGRKSVTRYTTMIVI